MKVAVVLSFLLIHVSQCARIQRKVESGDTCTTPLGVTGDCRGIMNCPVLLEVGKRRDNSSIALLRDSRCGPNREVCCPDLTEWLPRSCGKSFYVDTRIVNGTKAPLDAGAWPWIVALGYRSKATPHTSGLQWMCGGSLLTETHVITAAHCVILEPDLGKNYTLSVVRLGELDLEDGVDDGASPVDMQVESAVAHPGYRSSQLVNDIAIIKMKGRVNFTSLIQPICIQNTAQLGSPVGKTHHVAGWGKLKYNEERRSSTALQQVDVRVRSEERCQAAYWRFPKSVIDERVLCANNDGKDSCGGDSGGPLMYEHKGTYHLVGVVSYGYRCAEEGYPGGYSRVSFFLDWIISNLN